MTALPDTCIVCGEKHDPRAMFGDCAQPVCLKCDRDLQAEEDEDWYGISPHNHDLTRTGSYIGSTVRLELPAPDADGWIDLTPLGDWYPGWWFKPDEEDPGAGVYSRRK